MTKNYGPYTCDGCKRYFPKSKEFRVICPDCVDHAMSKMTLVQYKAWLIYNRARIWEGLPLKFWDDETIGDKDMYVSWGMCSDDVAAFPDPETWIYGEKTEPNHWDKTRIRTIGLGEGQYCPFDRRLVGDMTGTNPHNGCFWSCRVFGREIKQDDRDKAIAWFDKAIELASVKRG